LVADEEAPTEFALMANIENKVFDNSLFSNESVAQLEGRLTEYKVKEGVGYNAVHPPAIDLYLSPKKDLSWTGLPEFVDDTVTDYSRHSPTIVSTSAEGQNKDPSTTEDVASPNPPKPFVKFVKPKDKFVDDTVTDYSRHSPTIVSTSAEGQNKDPSTTEDVASPNPPKPFVKFVKPKDSQPESKSK
nr:hypothetical protein [Tanacetum cinerariifolium]